MTNNAEHILRQNKLRRTDVRMGVLKVFLNHEEALSHNDIEDRIRPTKCILEKQASAYNFVEAGVVVGSGFLKCT